MAGNGDVLEPHDGVMAIGEEVARTLAFRQGDQPPSPFAGSGGQFAAAAARALMDVPGMDAATIAGRAMKVGQGQHPHLAVQVV